MNEQEMVDLILRSRRNAEIGVPIAAMRPQRDTIGQSLIRYVDAIQKLLRVELCADQVEGGRWTPEAQSQSSREQAELVAAGGDEEFLRGEMPDAVTRTLTQAQGRFEAMLDHLRGIGVLLLDPMPVRPIMALSRVVAESAAAVRHVLDDQLSASERLAQTLNAEIEVLFRQRTRAKQAGSKTDEAEVQGEIDVVTQRALAHGLSSAGGKWPQYFDPYVATQSMVTRALNDGGQAYHQLSTFVHVYEDEGFKLAIGLDPATGNTQRTQNLAMHYFGPLLIAEDARHAVGGFTGVSFAAIEDLCEGVVSEAADAAGLFDDQYRAQLGVD